MKRIQIIGNATYGHRSGGRLSPKDKTSEPFEVEDAEALRLLRLGVAAYAEEAELPDTGEDAPDDDIDDDIDDDTDDATDGMLPAPAYHAKMSLEELKDIFQDCGLTYRVGMSKAEMVSYLDEHFATEDDGEAPPSVKTEEPVM